MHNILSKIRAYAVSNANSNAGAWGGAAPSPPPKRTSININHDQFLMNEAVTASALDARIQEIQQQEMFSQHTHQRDAQQHGKEHRGRQKGKHGREGADNANDGGWGASTAAGGWGLADQGNGWPQPAGNVDTWDIPVSVHSACHIMMEISSIFKAPGGFGAGIPAGGVAHNGTPRVGRSVFSDHDYEDERGTAVDEHGMGMNGGWGQSIV